MTILILISRFKPTSMHTIIGTGKLRIFYAIYPVCFFLVFSCRTSVNTDEDTNRAKAKVRVATISFRDMEEKVDLTTSTVYLDKGEILSPSSGYITALSAQPGDFVRKGQRLFSLETKEHHALQLDTSMNTNALSELGQLSVLAPADGFATNFLHAPGDYVPEGSALCSFVHSDKLLFQAYIPYSYNKLVNEGIPCTIILPDSTIIPAVFGRSLNTVDINSQTVLFRIIPIMKIFLPEGLNARLEVKTGSFKNAQVLPESALLSDETMQHFWIMKLINDSVAVKIPVRQGLRQGIWVQILNPEFNRYDRFIVEGNYGLSDTAKIEVQP
jgi:hypothetical protein